MCPGNCNWHGSCFEQHCICDPGYRSSDCHLPEDQIPTIHDFIDGYTCDVRERPCRRVAILASNVTDDSSLSCRVTFVDWTGKSGLVYKTKATLRTWTELVCELPDSQLVTNDNNENRIIGARHYWSVAISNDGERYTGGMKLLVWDSKCLNCTTRNSCIVKTDTCLIDNRCYRHYEGNPLVSSCSRCDPAVSTTEFTKMSNNRAPVLSGPFTIYKLRKDYYNSYLLATDSDSQNDLLFSLDSSLVISGVSLTSRGQLHVSDEVSDDITIKVNVTDSCGASDSEIFRIKTINCGCVAISSCSAELIRIKTHQYRCDWNDSNTVNSTEGCLSPACLEGVLCRLNPYRPTFDCQCKTRSRESRCSTGGMTVWTEWEEWSGCSKQCDYGIRTRRRECLDCPSPAIQTELCNKDQCTELKVEQHEGVIVKVQVADNNTAEEILPQFINDICTKNPPGCCSRDVCFKVLATIPGATYNEYCMKTSRKKRETSSNSHYIPPNTIKLAVTKSIRRLEQRIRRVNWNCEEDERLVTLVEKYKSLPLLASQD
ncbi:hypothetical protein LSH36_993g00047 [Paralvinella palmiformis]|uniref:Uncharacterized protein n=1 Tax=Paralvinella palmiformis TaxID=53620 RepID=A0AAD9IWF5_9ANNE|nr:hypothetical protein LSH36_993g00047 [Paralvinella palmiformis]